MIEFRGKLNYRNILYSEYPSTEYAPILDREGELIWRPWLGIISDAAARAKQTARPVRMAFVAYRYVSDFEWIDITTDQQVQGCLVPQGVYGVLERCKPRLLVARQIAVKDTPQGT